MGIYQRTLIRCFRTVLATLLLAAMPQILVAEIFGPFPPPLGAYWWIGSHDGNQIGSIVGNNDPITFTGGGDAGDWGRNWNGRYQVDADSGCQSGCQPGTFMGLPPQPGDSIFFRDVFIGDVSRPVSITGGFSLPANRVLFNINATFAGGTYDVLGASISTADGPSFPITFNGTTITTSTTIDATVFTDTAINFSGATLYSPTYTLSGGQDSAFNVHDGSELVGSVATVSGPVLVDVQGSQVELLGIGVSNSELAEDDHTDLRLAGGSTAIFHQFFLIGAEGNARVLIDESSHVHAGEAYVNVGENGMGDLYITGASTLEAEDFYVGLHALGNVSVDQNSSLFSVHGKIGEHVGHEGTVNLESGGLWESDELVVGAHGQGYLYVRNGGTLGVTNKLVVGEDGIGNLQIVDGGSATAGSAAVGENAGSFGSATSSGAGSLLTIENDLLVGVHGTGSLHVENGGTLTVNGPKIVLGEEEDGHGALTISTAGNLSFTGELIAGAFGSGVLALQAGAVYTASEVIVGEEATGIGDLNIDLASHLQVTGELIVAAHGNGNLNLRNGSILTTHKTVVGEHLTSAALVFVETESTWNTQELIIGDSGFVEMSVRSGASIHADEIVVAEHLGSFVEWAIEGEDSAIHAQGLFVGGSNMHSGGAADVIVADQAHVFAEHELIVWETAQVKALTGGITVGDDADQATDGTVRVNAHGELGGDGTIESDVLNAAGHVAPGHDETRGTLHVVGNYTQGADATLDIEIASAADYDALQVTGNMQLDGDLEVTLLGGFTPTVGQVFQLLAWGTLQDEFTHVGLPTLPAALVWDDSDLYGTGEIRVAPLVPGDFNGDGSVDTADYTVWRDSLGGMNLAADGNRDGAIDQLDYNVWRTHFGQGTGSGVGASANAAVPEPATLVLLTFAVAGWCLRRDRAA